ncbi:uncharacterized protein [Medicago truncatula]|uniref:uncharacterized protein n=1 Tax=Medicago truncatula TaxID=3880 RepID=UPI0019671C14|nr:uncharacterized protein LOC112417303 [Medicago truncatula]
MQGYYYFVKVAFKGTDTHLDFSNCLNLILGSLGRGSQLVQHLLNSAIIHNIWLIWTERNQRCFNDKHSSMTTLFNNMLAEVKLSYHLVLVKGNSCMQDFKISRLFSIPLHTKRVVDWCPPPYNTIKINCDGSSIGTQPCGAIGIVFRDYRANFLGAFASNIGHASAIEAEFSACMMAIEKARDMLLTQICLETDSLQVFKAYNKNIGVPWKMRSRWLNCLSFCKSINCSFMHTLREGNIVADTLAKNGQGLALYSTQWWPSPPNFILSLLDRDRLGLSISRMT